MHHWHGNTRYTYQDMIRDMLRQGESPTGHPRRVVQEQPSGETPLTTQLGALMRSEASRTGCTPGNSCVTTRQPTSAATNRLPRQRRPGDGHRPGAAAQLGDPEGDKRSVTEIEADEVGASLKWPRPRSNAPASAATATALRGGSGRPSGAATSTTRPHSDQPIFQRPRLSWGRWKIGSNFCDATCWSDPIPTIRAVAHLERSGRAGQRDVTDRE